MDNDKAFAAYALLLFVGVVAVISVLVTVLGITATEVEEALAKKGTTLVMINSVCGCSAGTARPGTVLAVQSSSKKPDYITTSFAGFDTEAINQVRKHLLPYPPSSPAIALFKDGQLVHMLERHNIEGYSAQMIADNLIGAFETHCN